MTDNAPVVFIEKLIPAPPKDVFEAWLDPVALGQFMKPAPGGTVSTVECDATVGGKFLIVMHVGDNTIPHDGEYLTIDRYHTLAFTWQSIHAGKGSVVTLRFADAPNGQTMLTLEHVGLADEKAAKGHHGGWSVILEELAKLEAGAAA